MRPAPARAARARSWASCFPGRHLALPRPAPPRPTAQLAQLFGWMQRPVPHTKETNSQGENAPQDFLQLHAGGRTCPCSLPDDSAPRPPARLVVSEVRFASADSRAQPLQRGSLPWPQWLASARSQHQEDPRSPGRHAGLFRYDAQLFELGTALFEEVLDRFPACRKRPRASEPTAMRNRVLTAAGIDPSEATQCGWQP